jgi:hypothetical protein
MEEIAIEYAQLTEENLKNLRRDIAVYLLESQSVTIAARTGPWPSSEGLLGVLHRTILLRQWDNLNAITCLIHYDLGHISGALLRAAYEELIWIKYLRSIQPKDAEELITCMYMSNTSDHAFKMDNAFGEEVMRKLCFPEEFKKRWRMNNKSVLQKLRELRRRLKWTNVDGTTGLPKMTFLAKETGNKIYELLYHITSVFVHFKVTELFRRTDFGDQEGVVSVDSKKFHLYWSTYSLFWGWWIYHHVLREFVEADMNNGLMFLNDMLTEKEGGENLEWLDRLFQKISKRGAPLPLHIEECLSSQQEVEAYNAMLESGKLQELIERGSNPITIVPPRKVSKQNK